MRVDNLLHTAKGSKGLRYKVTRKEFVKLSKELVDKSIMIADQVMSQAGIKPSAVSAVALTGGTSLIPAVREAEAETLIVADGASCRHQIEHGTKRSAVHAARLLRQALAENT